MLREMGGEIDNDFYGEAMKKLWVHAGMPKCGTSALQVFLARNRDNLKSAGVDYIELCNLGPARNGEITSGNAAFLARSMLNKNHEAYLDDKEVYRIFLKHIECNNNNAFLISSEFFSQVPFPNYEKFKNDLVKLNCSLHIIYYVRRQDQALMSTYMQRVKRHGYTKYPEDFVDEVLGKNIFLNYYEYAKKFENLVGKDNLQAFIYEQTQKNIHGLVGHFVNAILQECPVWIKSEKAINTSPSPLEIKLMLVANQYNPRMKFSDILVQNSEKTGRSKMFLTHNILPPSSVRMILEYYQEQNTQFERRYVKGSAFPGYEEEDFIDLKEISFTADEVLDFLVGFLVRFDRRIFQLEEKIMRDG